MDDDAAETLLRSLTDNQLELADRNNDLMDGTIDHIFSANELVVAIWQDSNAKNGVGVMVVKGQRILRDCIAKNMPINVAAAAIRCVDVEQALALKMTKGERDRLH
jgi:hypothetical protein